MAAPDLTWFNLFIPLDARDSDDGSLLLLLSSSNKGLIAKLDLREGDAVASAAAFAASANFGFVAELLPLLLPEKERLADDEEADDEEEREDEA